MSNCFVNWIVTDCVSCVSGTVSNCFVSNGLLALAGPCINRTHYVGKVLMGLSVALLCQQEDKPGRVGGEPVPSRADKVGSGQTSSGKPSEKVGKTWLDLTCLAMLCCAVVNGPLNYGCFHTSASHNCKATAVVIHLSLTVTASVQSNLNDTSQHPLVISQTLFK